MDWSVRKDLKTIVFMDNYKQTGEISQIMNAIKNLVEANIPKYIQDIAKLTTLRL